MSNITIEVWDATGNKKQLVELPADAPVNRVIAVLIDRMNLPRHSPDGQLMSYKFHHKASGRQLLDDQTLAGAEVRNGDVLRLQPEITAGADLHQIGPGAGDEPSARFRLIGWWGQDKLARARVLLGGAGALGNEVLKNLALLGVGNVFVADSDVVANSNLSRSVLFRAA